MEVRTTPTMHATRHQSYTPVEAPKIYSKELNAHVTLIIPKCYNTTRDAKCDTHAGWREMGGKLRTKREFLRSA